MSDGGRALEEEAHPAIVTHPGYARPAAWDWSFHTHDWSLQVDQAQVKWNPVHFLISDLSFSSLFLSFNLWMLLLPVACTSQKFSILMTSHYSISTTSTADTGFKKKDVSDSSL